MVIILETSEILSYYFFLGQGIPVKIIIHEIGKQKQQNRTHGK